MTKNFKQIKRGESTLYIVTLTDIPAPAGQVRRFRQFEFLRELADSSFSGMLNCGPLPYETMKISHDGEAWVAVLEAEEETK